MVGCFVNGSMTAVSASGMRSMSLWLIGWKPRIDEPSKPKPSSNASGTRRWNGTEVCCHLPTRSMNFKSTITAPLDFPSSIAFFASMLLLTFLIRQSAEAPFDLGKLSRGGGVGAPPTNTTAPYRVPRAGSNGFLTAFAGSNAHCFIDWGDEDLPVADTPGLGRLLDGVDDLVHHLVGDHDLEHHLRNEVHDVCRAAIDFLFSAGPAEALHLGDGHALDADFGQGVLHLVQLEGLDDRLDFLHDGLRGGSSGWPPRMGT